MRPVPRAAFLRSPIMRALKKLVLAIAVMGVVLGVALNLLWVILGEARLYPFNVRPAQPIEGFEQRRFSTGDGLAMPVWVAQPAGHDAPVILYFMGNFGSPDGFHMPLMAHRAAGRGVVAMGYRGGGGAPGHPDEAALIADATALHDQLDTLIPDIARRRIVAHGFSLGGGVAIGLAAARSIDGLILEGVPASVCALAAQRTLHLVAACAMARPDRWRNIDRLRREAQEILPRTLVIHGGADTLVPVEDGRRLGALAGAYVELPGVGHNQTPSAGSMTAIAAWLAGSARSATREFQ